MAFVSLLLFHTFVYTVTSQLQPSYSQYFQYPPPLPYTSSPGYPPESPAAYQPAPLTSPFPSYSPVQPQPPRFNIPPVLPPPSLSPPPLPALPSLTPCDGPVKPPQCPSSLDSDVINNLAIALQYLVASYIMTKSAPKNLVRESFNLPVTSMPVLETLKPLPPLTLPSPVRYTSVTPQIFAPFSSVLPQKSLYQVRPNIGPQILTSGQNVSPQIFTPAQPSYVNTYDVTVPLSPPSGFPCANFIGSSSYGDSGSLITNFGNPYGPPPKPCSRCLKSPYEAIDTNRDFVTMDFY